jgi:hypothetical protein
LLGEFGKSFLALTRKPNGFALAPLGFHFLPVILLVDVHHFVTWQLDASFRGVTLTAYGFLKAEYHLLLQLLCMRTSTEQIKELLHTAAA